VYRWRAECRPSWRMGRSILYSLTRNQEEDVMNTLSPRDRELVALGAAMGSGCASCIESHIPESRRAGLTDEEIRVAIQHADRIRQVPACKTLDIAQKVLASAQSDAADAEARPTGGCGAESHPGGSGAEAAPPRMDAMMEMMRRMMASHCRPPRAAEGTETSGENPDVGSAAGEGCGCAPRGARG